MVEAKNNKNNNKKQSHPIHHEEINIIEERPVLDKIETLVHKDVIEQAHIHETVKQREIEIHETPIEKQVIHPERQLHVQMADEFEVYGREKALSEREKILGEIKTADQQHEVRLEERSEVRVIEQAPSVSVDHEVTREIIERPIVTEIHHQPVKEVHEREIHRTIYETPIVKVVRDEKVKEVVNVNTTIPLAKNIEVTNVKDQRLL